MQMWHHSKHVLKAEAGIECTGADAQFLYDHPAKQIENDLIIRVNVLADDIPQPDAGANACHGNMCSTRTQMPDEFVMHALIYMQAERPFNASIMEQQKARK
jgi:hypothetical protein